MSNHVAGASDPRAEHHVLTPDEIRVKEFLPSRRGYDADEVRAFLAQIADALHDAERRASLARSVAPVPAAPAAVVPSTPQPVQAVHPAQPIDRELASKVVRLSEELEVAVWTMRRLEATVQRLEERLNASGGADFLAS